MVADFRFRTMELKEMTMQQRLMTSMLAYEADMIFYTKAANILRERQPKDHSKWDKNDVSRIKDFNRNVEECVNTLSLLKSLYESEYDDYVVAETVIKQMAMKTANHKLVGYRWIKEG